MKNFWKKTASGILALLLVAGASPAAMGVKTFELSALSASAEDDVSDNFTYSVNDEGTAVTITKWIGSGSEVVVPETIEGIPVTAIGSWAFAQNEDITSVKLPDTITEIENNAFNGCKAMAEINLPDGLKIIDNTAFSSCSSLTAVTIPDSVEKLGVGVFSSCSALETISIPSSVTSIGESAFRDTAWLKAKKLEDPLVIVNHILIDGTSCAGNVYIPEDVTSICDMAFSNCRNLIKVRIPESVKSIGGSAFSYCSALDSIVITNGVESIGYQAFIGCDSLKRVTIPDSVTSIGGGAFAICGNLEYVKLPEGLTTVSNTMFQGCSSLKYINIPDSVKTIDVRAFASCPSLTKIVIPDSVESIGFTAFMGCSNLRSLYVPASVTYIGPSAFSRCPDLIIRGEANSTAESYASQNILTFYDQSVADAEINGVSLTLSDDLGLNFVVGAATDDNKDDYSVKLTGVCAENGKTLPLSAKTVNGEKVYCVTANVTANNMQEDITAELYKGDVLIDTVKYSSRSYLREIADIRGDEHAPSYELMMYSSALTYGYAAENYFNNGTNNLSILDDEEEIEKCKSKIHSVYSEVNEKHLFVTNDLYKPDNEEAKFSLVLDSKMAVRLYIKDMPAGTKDTEGGLISAAGRKGGSDYPSYFEIKDITPLDLGKDNIIKVGDKTYKFSALAWAYRMLSNENADVKNKRMAAAIARYAFDAYQYVHGEVLMY